MPNTVRFYLDENVPVAVASQLKKRDIAVVTVRDLGLLGDSDLNHLKRATEMGYVLCTHDADYLQLATQGIEHSGIVYGVQDQNGIGEWVKFLELLCAVCTADEMKNRIEFL